MSAAQPGSIPMTTEPGLEEPADGIALCLSGGGYRAMLYHLGTLWYLHHAAILAKLARVSSVSGGSITTGVLALNWTLAIGGQDGFRRGVVEPIRRMASTTIDKKSILGGIFLPGTVSDRIVANYRKLLFGDKTLQDFPDTPRFVINATNVQTGSLFRFSKPYIADWRLGRYLKPRTSVAEAVAASSAFPPVLSPVRLEFAPTAFSTDLGPQGRPPFTTSVNLTDGGVYDNMGIETTWKRYSTILVSDAGGRMQPQERPHADWARHALRVNELIDNQVRSLRKRQIVAAFLNQDRKGAYWGMWTDPAEYPATSALDLPKDKAGELARTPTRLAELPDEVQERLINFGYGMAERAVRSYYDPSALAATTFPYPRGI